MDFSIYYHMCSYFCLNQGIIIFIKKALLVGQILSFCYLKVSYNYSQKTSWLLVLSVYWSYSWSPHLQYYMRSLYTVVAECLRMTKNSLLHIMQVSCILINEIVVPGWTGSVVTALYRYRSCFSCECTWEYGIIICSRLRYKTVGDIRTRDRIR